MPENIFYFVNVKLPPGQSCRGQGIKHLLVKIFLLLSFMSMLASCGAKDRPPLFTNDTIMQEYNIIELVKQNNIDGVKKHLTAGLT
ncbi:hypothetical protein LWM68_14985 [Niabella sp. W65]|nr:hypothetical protein [Niabella sp. W65]MCH7363949.1 hypothetical protein [Niabella sp. W65]ULT39840.1 hypothetical protein KRR40_33785 [Niabella sp. I65]